ncbi:MAG: hypothetical protein COB86_03205 [Dehalococcoidia bacterium]|jgi:hypothetical protein|nr:MAG: hypothetical protein COB86_03205 [Dehalococcoidia bacterium]
MFQEFDGFNLIIPFDVIVPSGGVFAKTQDWLIVFHSTFPIEIFVVLETATLLVEISPESPEEVSQGTSLNRY